VLVCSSVPLLLAQVAPIVQQLVGRTVWGDLDYLIVDMPPGTGDVQLTLSQEFRVSAAVLVTTPQRLSFVDVVKGVEMFDKVGIPTVAVVENMSELRLTELAEQVELAP
jgi:Mrp family chromosome partitioning ATPase